MIEGLIAEVERLKAHLQGCESNHESCLDLLDAERKRADEALAAKVVAIAEKQQAERERDEAVDCFKKLRRAFEKDAEKTPGVPRQSREEFIGVLYEIASPFFPTHDDTGCKDARIDGEGEG